jgi:CRISPR type III-B/RAMP module RAMP protein Cmr6
MKVINLPSDTRLALGSLPLEQCSRSLYFDRFARPELEKDERRKFFTDGFACRTSKAKSESWVEWLRTSKMGLGLKPESILFAQLKSRLMVNMAGGVMENAGLCLDRFGLPYIPGSAVKGCSRRMAIQRLLEAETPEAEDARATKKALLLQIALTFGWAEQDWENDSDFSYACDSRWDDSFIETAQRSLWKQVFGADPPEDYRLLAGAWKKRLSHFSGQVQFLPALPVEVKLSDPFHLAPKAFGDLELEVLTCHHKQYYGEPPEPKNVPQSDPKWQKWKREHDRWQAEWGKAPDTEEPNPVVFPAVAPGHVFVFAPRAIRSPMEALASVARRWLADGLQAFGLGAKTNAGYGWFDCSSDLQTRVREALLETQRNRTEEKKRREEEQRLKNEQEEFRQRRAKAAEATKSMSDEERQLYALGQLGEQQFLSKLDRWKDLSHGEKTATYTLMRREKTALWLDIKQKASGGKQKEKARWGQLVQDLFKMAKERKEKMP